MLIPDPSGAGVKRLRVSRVWLGLGVLAAVLVALLVGGVLAHDLYVSRQLAELHQLRAENVRLRAQVGRLDERVETLGRVVERVKRFDLRLRKLTLVSDPERNLAMGPVGAQETSGVDSAKAGLAQGVRADLLGGNRLEAETKLLGDRLALETESARETESSVRRLYLFLEDQQAMLSATPSLVPAKGWLTSGFGFRVDPYTGLKQMHSGLDVSADIGAPVVATADGVVIWAGPRGALGNLVIIDHGQGLTSHYGHLSKVHAVMGEEIRRGTSVGEVGNTGRSTGPHLHYEIHLSGVPQNPGRFILEDGAREIPDQGF